MSRPARTSAVMTDTGATAPLDELLERERRAPLGAESPVQTPFVGYCVSARHPELRGRALIRWTARGNGDPEEHWLPCLRSLELREGDSVMVAPLSNFDDPVVIGVLDGLEVRPEAPGTSSHSLLLGAADRLRVHAADGTPLVEISPAPDGPVIHLLSSGLALRVPGKFALDADRIELRAQDGPVVINASRDVEVNGERIRLNSPDEVPEGAKKTHL